MRAHAGSVGSVILGVLVACLAAILVFAITPIFLIQSSPTPLMQPINVYASVSYSYITVESMTDTYQLNVTVTALPEWNVSELVTLHFSGVEAINGETGRVEIPPGPYDITFIPAVALLNPGSSVVFNLSFIPWPNATDILDEYSSVSFIWMVDCLSYPKENPSSGIYLGAAYIFADYGEGPWWSVP
jgi:hypothetical protein